jgi:hypothetical protein
MARFTCTGTPLGIRSKPYDIDNGDGTRNKGVSHRLVMFDHESVTTTELSVRQEDLGYFESLVPGEVVSLPVDVFANSARGGGATLSATAVVPPSESGKRAA